MISIKEQLHVYIGSSGLTKEEQHRSIAMFELIPPESYNDIFLVCMEGPQETRKLFRNAGEKMRAFEERDFQALRDILNKEKKELETV